MNDTPEYVKQKQLEIWLAKSPEERLRLTLVMNDELYAFWNEGRKNDVKIPLNPPPSK
ncbi:hypothetical protein KXD93_10150 [Mucilaginibacter sp. BJC16-A38]|uniref:hypothetical protein n=1 Tax=Mucilaginibacter phenanthrenivorans TaxID=1234842 RepID=UPI002157E740|nr:hypothetical protein [Mucilaginibacter phenanthrenivorans]MCR8558006.1 hypothetical protein [Mucilaginibacter phenanthrenivorans]